MPLTNRIPAHLKNNIRSIQGKLYFLYISFLFRFFLTTIFWVTFIWFFLGFSSAVLSGLSGGRVEGEEKSSQQSFSGGDHSMQYQCLPYHSHYYSLFA